MAFSYQQRECDTCGGPLRYLEDEKVYECTYCGNRYERTESYDGQFSVRHVAEQALAALVERDMDLVAVNLNDCQKIDPSYPGSVVAHIAYQLQVARDAPKGSVASQSAIQQAVALYRQLPTPFDPRTCDTEADFYERLTSSDVRSLLKSVFAMLRDEARASYVLKGFDPSAMHSAVGTAAFVQHAFGEGQWEQLDELVASTADYDATALALQLMDSYPAGPRKAENLAKVVGRGVDADRVRQALSDYVVSSSDDEGCKVSVAQALAAAGISMKGASLAQVVAQGAPSHVVRAYADAMASVPQADEDVSEVTTVALTRMGSEDAAYVLGGLARAGAYLDFTQRDMVAMLTRGDLTVPQKAAFLDLLGSFGIDEARMQAALAGLLNTRMDLETKPNVVTITMGRMPWVNPRRIEEYLLRSTLDGEAKPLILERLLSSVSAKATLRQAARRYLEASPDEPHVRAAVVEVLRRAGLAEG